MKMTVHSATGAAATVVFKAHLGLSAPVHQDISSSMTQRPAMTSMSVWFLVSAASSATMKEEASGATVLMVTS